MEIKDYKKCFLDILGGKHGVLERVLGELPNKEELEHAVDYYANNFLIYINENKIFIKDEDNLKEETRNYMKAVIKETYKGLEKEITRPDTGLDPSPF